MHFNDPDTPVQQADSGPWYKELTRYHWFVLIVSALGWLFDCLDQQLFNLARGPAMRELVGAADVQFLGGLSTTIFMLGWATGGIIFGILGDRIGRAKTMVLTILIYSACTGLSAVSWDFLSFAFFRFVTGLGVGGEFAVGIALVAEVMPDRARPHALGWLQALSAVGNITAAFVSMGLAPLEAAGALGDWQPWRVMFVVGALPALLALLIRRRLKEPERWVAMRRAHDTGGQKLGSLAELFGDPVLRRNAIVGLLLATSGVVGLWGIGFFSFDLVRSVFRQKFEGDARTAQAIGLDNQFVRRVVEQGDEPIRPKAGETIIDWAMAKVKPNALLNKPAQEVYLTALELHKKKSDVSPESVLEILQKKTKTSKELDVYQAVLEQSVSEGPEVVGKQILERQKEIEGRLTLWAGINGLLFNIGAFFGIYSFAKVTHYVGRKPAFFVAFILAMASTAYAFWNLKNFEDIFWMVPIMGFCQISLFGGYAIYFPELFPTRLRSTGTSFCYNVGRYIAAAGPLLLGVLAQMVFGQYGEVESWRYAGVAMCSFFLLGLAALPFAPETRGKPLPE